MRSVRARRLREAWGKAAKAASGALGISRVTGAVKESCRRTATSIPPALTFSAVANSRDSFPCSSRLRTKTGIASGSRAHFRRSLRGFFALTRTSWRGLTTSSTGAPRGPKPGRKVGENGTIPDQGVRSVAEIRNKTGNSVRDVRSSFALGGAVGPGLHHSEVQRFATLG